MKLLSVSLAVAALAACQAQGDYTQEASEEALAGIEAIRAGTEYDQAARMYKSGNLTGALASIESSITRLPEIARAHLLHARILLELDRIQDAMVALDRADVIEPQNPDYLYLRGILYEQLGHPEKAEEQYRGALKLSPAREDALLALVEVLVQQAKADEAGTLLENAPDELRSSPAIRHALGHLAMLQGDTERALVYFREAVILGPGDPYLLEDLARTQATIGLYRDALESLGRLGSFDNRPDLMRLQASCLIHTNRPLEARAVLMKLTKGGVESGSFESWRLLADVGLMLDDNRLLLTAAERMTLTSPDDPRGYLGLALAFRKAGDLAAALEQVQKAAARSKPFPEEARAAARLEGLVLRDMSGN